MLVRRLRLRIIFSIFLYPSFHPLHPLLQSRSRSRQMRMRMTMEPLKQSSSSFSYFHLSHFRWSSACFQGRKQDGGRKSFSSASMAKPRRAFMSS